jgi:hypothetical protein
MRYFFHYWFVAVPKLTLAQAYSWFYKFIRFAGCYTDRGWYYDENVIHLNEEESKRFIEALENPPEPSEALREAARKYKGHEEDPQG